MSASKQLLIPNIVFDLATHRFEQMLYSGSNSTNHLKALGRQSPEYLCLGATSL
jgi:hypothetical protein